MILSQAQADAVYSAMCNLNNVGARFGSVHMPDGRGVCQYEDGVIVVSQVGGVSEAYNNPAQFREAYNLN